MPPTLYKSGVLVPLNPKIKKEELDKYIALHYILDVMNYKMSKKDPNLHDRLFLLKSQTGTGKSTSFVSETYRRFLGKAYGKFESKIREVKESYQRPTGADLTVYDFPDDPYTIANRKDGFKTVNKITQRICCTQPKVLTAKSKALEEANAPYNPDLELGENIGFNTGPFKQPISNPKGIMFSTLGSLITELKNNSDESIMEKYLFIMIDECHIRQKDLDEAMIYIREFLRRNSGNPSCPLFIFMSATFDVPKYAKFLGTFETNAVLVEGSKATYETLYHDEYLAKIGEDPNRPVVDWVKETFEKVIWIHENNLDDTPAEADILIFSPGLGMVDGAKIMSLLEKYSSEHGQPFIVYKLTGELVNKGGDAVARIETMKLDEVKKLEDRPNAIRRITVSTSVAETGLTIKALKYVIDAGFNKTGYYNPNHNINILITKNVVRSAMEQRLGRVGRDFYGYAHTMYSKEVMQSLPEYEYPDTYTSDSTSVVLSAMYASIPGDYIDKTLVKEQFLDFHTNCLDPDKPKLSDKNVNCYNTYMQTTVDNSEISSVKNFTEKKLEGMNNVTKIFPIHNYPPEMLDNLPQDLYIEASNRLISLGFYGTYAGFLASKFNKSTVEGVRMILSSVAYGVSLGDACILAHMTYLERLEYKTDPRSAKRNGVPLFSYWTLLKEMASSQLLKQYFFGSVQKFDSMVKDDFIEGLLICKFVVKLAKSIKESDVKKFKIKYRKVERIIRTPTKLDVLNQKCWDYGINLAEVRKIFLTRMDFMKTASNLNIPDLYDDFQIDDQIIDRIARLKRCIYAGLKNNLVLYDSKEKTYKTRTGLLVRVRETEPHNIMLYNQISLLQFPGKIIYEGSPVLLSSLDGWIC